MSVHYHHQYRHQTHSAQWYDRSPHNAMHRPFGAFSVPPSPSPSPTPSPSPSPSWSSPPGSGSGSAFLPGAAESSFCPTAFSRSAERHRRLTPPNRGFGPWGAGPGPSPPPYIPTPEEVREEAARAAWEAEEQAYFGAMQPGPRFPSNLMRGGRDAWVGRLYEEQMQREREAEEKRLQREQQQQQQGRGLGRCGRAVWRAIRHCFSWPFSSASGAGAEAGAEVDYAASADADTDASVSGYDYDYDHGVGYGHGFGYGAVEEVEAEVFPIHEPLAKVYIRRLGRKLQSAALWLALSLLVMTFMWGLEILAVKLVETVVEGVLGIAGFEDPDAPAEVVYVLVENYRSWCVA